MALIAISGKIHSGKDTIGKIIQWLILNSKRPLSEDSKYFNHKSYDEKSLTQLSGVEIKKFADKLKDIVCLLINCTKEQLEDTVFKNTPLGEEWDCWINNSSKITNPPKLSIENPHDFFNDAGGVSFRKMTPRLLMQLLGTECGRDIIHPNIWVNALFTDYKRPSHWENRYYEDFIFSAGYVPIFEIKKYDEINKKGLAGREEVWGEYPNWIITDMRFPNEMEAVEEREGITIRVHRDLHNGNAHISPIPHESEIALDDAKFDYEIINDGTIEDLVEKVRVLLIKEGII